MFQQAAAKAGIAAERVTGYAADSTQAQCADAALGEMLDVLEVVPVSVQ